MKYSETRKRTIPRKRIVKQTKRHTLKSFYHNAFGSKIVASKANERDKPTLLHISHSYTQILLDFQIFSSH